MVTFTPAEDHHIIRLKEQVGGTWNNIQAAFAGLFPGTERNAGGLQVRYSRYLQAGKGSRAAALVFVPQQALAPIAAPAPAPAPVPASVPAPPVPAPAPVTAAPTIAAPPPAQSAQAGGRAPTRRSARQTVAAATTRRQKKVATGKTRSRAPAPAPAPAPPRVSARVRARARASAPAPVIVAISSASSAPPPSPTTSDFDPPSLEEIEAFRRGDAGARAVFPSRSLSEDVDEEEAEGEEADGGEVVEIEIDAPARRTRGAVKSGRVVKPQSKAKGKGKEKEKVVRAPVKRNKELVEKLAAIKWMKPGTKQEEYGWEDDRWADLTGKW